MAETTDKLNKWTELLLDTGNKNNLVNFKDTKSTVEIVVPSMSELYELCDKHAGLSVFDPVPSSDEEADTVEMSRDEWIAQYSAAVPRNKLLLYSHSGAPQDALNNIRKRAQSAVDEVGVNIAYAAFGFIEHADDGAPGKVFRAPVLLVPITVRREKYTEPYTVIFAHDDAVVNPTFSFKLQSEYGITLPPLDDADDVEAYLSAVESTVSALGWRILRECKLGLFSFLKLNMYADLRANADVIVANPSIKAMLGERTDNVGGTVPPRAGDLLSLHNVVDADSSQAEAIEAARVGKSFVLQGPPGTGKSQTITNMIAELLAAGKKVLFVSEKSAALQVVYEKLKAARLDEFCLELHSYKTNKKAVIDELCNTLRAEKTAVSDRAGRETVALDRTRRLLDSYADALHTVRPVINATPYELSEKFHAFGDAPDVDYVIADIETKGENYFEEATGLLGRYIESIPEIGVCYRDNVWYGYTGEENSYEFVSTLKKDLAALGDYAIKARELSERINAALGLGVKNLDTLYAALSVFDVLIDRKHVSQGMLGAPYVALKRDIEVMQLAAERVVALRAALDKNFDGGIYDIDGAHWFRLLTTKYKSGFSRLFGGAYRKFVAELNSHSKHGKVKYEGAVSAMRDLSQYAEAMAEFAKTETRVRLACGAFGGDYRGVDTDFARMLADMDIIADAANRGVNCRSLYELTDADYSAAQSEAAKLRAAARKLVAEYSAAEKFVAALFAPERFDIYRVSFDALKDKASACRDNTDKLDGWCEFDKMMNVARAIGLDGYIDYAVGVLPPEQIIPAYGKLFYRQWLDYALRSCPELYELARLRHDEAVSTFIEKDELNFDINIAKIRSALSAKRPSLDLVAPGSAVANLLREGEKKRKQKNVRPLLAENIELIQTLKPCFLMSPLSVSTFLTPDVVFDTVIFDEASQIFPQDAVGAIYRGKQLIVVGDSKQMPPSNFFNASVESDADFEDEEDERSDVADFESVLDICSAVFPQRRLRWHYRSRAEQLIAFSNKNFYDGALVTFPGPGVENGMGVRYCHVDGVFDRKSKTNRIEAEKVVDLVYEHFSRYPERSLGVVAFSAAQQNLIDRLIVRRRMSDEAFDRSIRANTAEPFFVKNLETVQGDERDSIIFGMAYAKDANGKFILNFGPLNREGGERRLNVAVTRAKCDITLVSSVHASDIDLSRTKSRGVKLLRDYLEYAERGGDKERIDEQNDDRAFEGEVCEFLTDNGYTVDRRVGCSSLRIDLAVRQPGSRNYIMAIECDGDNYHACRNARDRDRLRMQVLSRMGWRYYRVWSMDWFRNESAEKKSLLAAVESAVENAMSEADETDDRRAENDDGNDVSFEERRSVVHFEFPTYVKCDDRAVAKRSGNRFLPTLKEILETETPLAEEWALKRLAFLFGKDKVTSTVRERYKNECEWFSVYGIVRIDGFLYKRGADVPMLRIPSSPKKPEREIKYISLEELSAGLLKVIELNVNIDRAGLFRFVSGQLGFRPGDAITARLEAALRLIKDRITDDGENISFRR